MVIVLIHSVEVQPLILGEALRGVPCLKKTQCKGTSLFCQNKQFMSKNVFLHVLVSGFGSSVPGPNYRMSWGTSLCSCRGALSPGVAEPCQAPYVLQRDGCVQGDEWRVPGHPLERRHCRKINSPGLCRHLSGLNMLDADLSIFHIGCSALLRKNPTG